MLMISYINIMLTIRARIGRAQLNLKFHSNQNKFTQNNITAICCRKCVKVSFSYNYVSNAGIVSEKVKVISDKNLLNLI